MKFDNICMTMQGKHAVRSAWGLYLECLKLPERNLCNEGKDSQTDSTVAKHTSPLPCCYLAEPGYAGKETGQMPRSKLAKAKSFEDCNQRYSW